MGIFDKLWSGSMRPKDSGLDLPVSGQNDLDGEGADPPFRHSIRLGDRRIPLPRSRLIRIIAGIVLILLGFVGFLPIIGFWMIPLGLLILSVDFAPIRRFRRRTAVWLQRKWVNWKRGDANGPGKVENNRPDNPS